MIYFAHIVPKRSWMVWPIRYIGVLSTTLTYVLAPVVFAAVDCCTHLCRPCRLRPRERACPSTSSSFCASVCSTEELTPLWQSSHVVTSRSLLTSKTSTSPSAINSTQTPTSKSSWITAMSWVALFCRAHMPTGTGIRASLRPSMPTTSNPCMYRPTTMTRVQVVPAVPSKTRSI